MPIPQDKTYYENNNKMKVPIPDIEMSGGGEGATEYFGESYTPKKKKLNYEADGEGSKGPAAR